MILGELDLLSTFGTITESIGSNVELYPVSANEINVEFNVQCTMYNVQCKIGDNVIEMPLGERVYTFEYDYRTPFEIVISNEEEVIETKVVYPDDVIRRAGRAAGNNYYIYANTLYSNANAIDTNYIHIYDGKVLSNNGFVYDLSSMQQVNTEQVVGLKLLEDTKAIAEYNYEGKNIKTYSSFSEIQEGEEQVIREQQLFVKNGQLSVIDGKLNKVSDGVIIDNYNENEYQTVLRGEKLVDYKTPLNYPEDFKNSGIQSITNNLRTSDSIILVYYNTGRAYAFDYIAGEEVFDNSIKEDIDILGYIIRALSSMSFGLEENLQEEYEESKLLEEKLTQTPIGLFLNDIVEANDNNTEVSFEETVEKSDTNTSVTSKDDSYVTVYDADSSKYSVYKKSEILKTSKEDLVSENSVIASNKELQTFYFTEAKKTVDNDKNGMLWIGLTLTAVAVGLVVLYKKRK